MQIVFDNIHRPPPLHHSGVGSPGSQSTLSPISISSPVSGIPAANFSNVSGGMGQNVQQQQPSSSQGIHGGHHTPTSSDACASIVHSLMCHRQVCSDFFRTTIVNNFFRPFCRAAMNLFRVAPSKV